MKQDKYILRTFFIFILTFLIGAYQTCEAQLVDGNYYYGNPKQDIVLNVTDVGQKIDLVIIKKDCKECASVVGKGEWIYINLKGVDEGYEGVDGWYDIQINDTTYVEVELAEYNSEIGNYETITLPIPNSDNRIYLQLNHYIETK